MSATFEAHRTEAPASAEAEQSVLGGLLLDNGRWAEVAELLTPRAFFDGANAAIFGAIGELIEAGQPADVVTVFERLQARGTADDVGGLPYLNDLAQAVPSAQNIQAHARLVLDHANRRALAAIGDETKAAALNADGRPLAQILEGAQSRIRATLNKYTKRCVSAL